MYYYTLHYIIFCNLFTLKRQMELIVILLLCTDFLSVFGKHYDILIPVCANLMCFILLIVLLQYCTCI